MEVSFAAQLQSGSRPSGHCAERRTQERGPLRTAFVGRRVLPGASFQGGLAGLAKLKCAPPVRRKTAQQAVTLASQVQPLPTRSRSSSKPANAAWDKSAQALDGKGTLAQIRALIGRLRQVKNGWEGSSYWGVQPSREVRERTEGLLHRVATLQHFAEQHTGPDGTVPVQVLATMKALQRELGSLENIVRLANDSGATVMRSRGSFNGHVPSSFPMVNGKHRTLLRPVRSPELQHEAVKKGQGDGLRNGRGQAKSGRAYAGASEYEVSAPAGKGASPLAAFRKEIERRVIEQLSSKMKQAAPTKVDRGMDAGLSGDAAKVSPIAEPLWREENDWAWSEDNILDTGLVDRRKAEFDLGPNEESRTESSFLASTSGSDTWKNQQYVKGPEILRQQKIRAMEDAIRTAESERLRMELIRMQAELKLAESSTARAKVNELESKVGQLELELSRSVPLSIHDEVVKKLQGTVSELRFRIQGLEGIVRERESMITTVSSNLVAERDAVVRKMTLELSQRVTPEEVDRVVASTVSDVRAELAVAQGEVSRLAQSLEEKDLKMAHKMQAWEKEKSLVNAELEATIKRMVTIEATVEERRAEVLREQVRAMQLEKELASLLQERDAFTAGAVAEKDALLQQVAVLERSLNEGELGAPFAKPNDELGDAESEAFLVRQDADEDQTELERVRFELKGLMKVAEAGQLEVVLEKIADLLVSLSNEVGVTDAGMDYSVGAGDAIDTNEKMATRAQENVSAAPLSVEQKAGSAPQLRTALATSRLRPVLKLETADKKVDTLRQDELLARSEQDEEKETPLVREPDPSAPEEEFISEDDPQPAKKQEDLKMLPVKEPDPSAPEEEFISKDDPQPAKKEEDQEKLLVKEPDPSAPGEEFISEDDPQPAEKQEDPDLPPAKEPDLSAPEEEFISEDDPQPATKQEESEMLPVKEPDPSAPEEEFISKDDPQPAKKQEGPEKLPSKEPDPSAPDREFIDVDNPTPAEGESAKSDGKVAATPKAESKLGDVLGSRNEERGTKIRLFYETGWENAYVHYSIDGKSWTEPPGLEMTNAVNSEGVPVKMLELPAESLEFVLTNSTGDWDKPSHGGNYLVDHAGTFSLSSGTIKHE